MCGDSGNINSNIALAQNRKRAGAKNIHNVQHVSWVKKETFSNP